MHTTSDPKQYGGYEAKFVQELYTTRKCDIIHCLNCVHLLKIFLVPVEVEVWSGEDSVVLLPGAHGCLSPSLIQFILTLEQTFPVNILIL